MMSRSKGIVVTFAGCLMLFVLANLISVHLRSDGGLLEGLGLVNRMEDDIRGFGFPFAVWEEGGFAYRHHFSGKALLGNTAIAIICSGLVAMIVGITRRRAGSSTAEHAGGCRGHSGPMWIALALVITLATRAIPDWYIPAKIWTDSFGHETYLPYPLFHTLVLLAIGLCLALSAPRRSGLQLGSLRAHWRGVLLVCGVPILLCALVYPNLPERPFAGAHWGMWAVSPLAQDLVFIGFLYGQLERVFPGCIHPRLALSWGLVLTSLFFALWHLPNLSSTMSGAYVAFQMCYVVAGLVVIGLSRQWTGSILYATATHSAVNAIAWLSS